MNEAQAIEAICQRWVTSWAALQPSVPSCLENEAFTAPDTWARVKIQLPASRQTSLGPVRRFERTGTIFVQLFVLSDTGTAAIMALVADVRTTFEAQQLAADLWTYAMNTSPGIIDGRWYMITCSTPVVFYESR